jgi:hypothetical protein
LNKTVERALKKNPWTSKTIDSLILNQSPALARYEHLVHAFTTRHGGNSPSPVDNFNLGRHLNTSESRADAAINRAKLCSALGLDVEKLSVPAQVHSPLVLVADQRTIYADVDGLCTNIIGKPLLLHFADCVPVMIYDPVTAVLCIVHAGWKGTAGSIARNGVKLMESQFGAKAANMVAAIGPAIGTCCYPTGVDVAQKLRQTVAIGAQASSLPELFIEQEGQVRPDLKGINALQLLDSNVGEVDVSELCTACNPATFYSHRQSGGHTGRQGAIAALI